MRKIKKKHRRLFNQFEDYKKKINIKTDTVEFEFIFVNRIFILKLKVHRIDFLKVKISYTHFHR